MTGSVTTSNPGTVDRPGRPRSRFLVQSIKLEERGPPGAISVGIVLISLMLVGAIAWAGVTNLDEVALAEGEVVPAGSVHAVQHLEGGIVRRILVRDGDIVEAGDTLLRMAPEATRADLDQMLVRQASLLLQSGRLHAFAEGRVPNFELVSELYDDLKAGQLAIYRTQMTNRADQVTVLQDQRSQQRAELQRTTNRADALRNQTALLREELDIRTQLLERGLTSRIIHLETQRELVRAQGELTDAIDTIATTEAAIDEINSRLAELDSRLRSEALIEAGDVAAELAQIEETLKNLIDRVARLEVRAPLRGIVTGLRPRSINTVVQPGEVLMEIVPLGDDLVVEARVSPRDIGHVERGQAADIRVSSYDFARFGAVRGTVQQISATTFLDEQLEPYYRAMIALDRDYVGDQPGVNRIIPGMTVQADIKTGSKSILDYLLRPIYRGLHGAFRER
ncbi:MAG: HlyD family type I secretion periplasmic adaptor subunit [Alphaproteobacteria bacterium]